MKHPLSIAGAIIFVGSWFFLLFGSGADEYRSVINLHKLAVAHAGIVSGLGLVVLGLLADGLAGLLPSDRQVVALPAEQNESTVRQPTMSSEELTKALAAARDRLNKA